MLPCAGWFLPRGAGGAVSPNDAAEARRLFKQLVTTGPRWMLWAATGSSLATFWINAAMTLKGGVALMTHHRLVRNQTDVHTPQMLSSPSCSHRTLANFALRVDSQ